MRTRNYEPPADAGRRDLQRCVESGWQVGSQWRRRWRGESVFEVQRGSRQAGIVLLKYGAGKHHVVLIVRFLYLLFRPW